jgi:uncharacterized protein
VIDGMAVVDAHVHAPRLPTVRPAWLEWAARFGAGHDWRSAYGADGAIVPERLDALFQAEGVDVALLFCEYSPRATGIQSIEDNLPIVAANPRRFRLVANVNPHLHYPLAAEVERQLDLGAVALKLHPVHAGFGPSDAELYPAYAVCRERGVPVIIHCGTSSFPGSRTRYADPQLLLDAIEDHPDVPFILAHGGRGWWYDAAAFLALSRDNVYLDLSGLPPSRLRSYYANFTRLAPRCLFGTDWPGVPGTATNVRDLAALDLPPDTLRAVLAGNAAKLFPNLGI